MDEMSTSTAVRRFRCVKCGSRDLKLVSKWIVKIADKWTGKFVVRCHSGHWQTVRVVQIKVGGKIYLRVKGTVRRKAG